MKQTDAAPDKEEFGTRDEKRIWKPPCQAEFSPLFDWPIKPLVIVKWIFGYLGYL